MFSFFKRKTAGRKVTDFIWMNGEQKTRALIQAAKSDPATVFIGWFEDTCDQLIGSFRHNGIPVDNIFTAQKVHLKLVEGRPVIFIEHHPLADKEKAFYEKLGLNDVTVYLSLDEPLMQLFGGERIIELMKKLGASDSEAFQHSLISSSIARAQEKIKTKMAVEHSARSQEEWLRKNFGDQFLERF